MIRVSIYSILIAAVLSTGFSSCRKTEIKKEYKTVESYENLPQVGTPPLDSVLFYEAYGSCRVYAEGNSPVTECGLCWGTEPQPLRLGNRIGTGQGKGITKGKIEGLKPSTTYYLRAYAKNSEGIAYGNEITFTTSAGWSKYVANPMNNAFTDMLFVNGVFYGCSYSGVFTSSNLMQNWSNKLQYSGFFKNKGNIIYLPVANQIYFSSNNGDTWTSMYGGGYVEGFLVADALYTTSGYSVRKSVNNGSTWTTQNSGISSSYLRALEAKGTDIYLASEDGIYKSNNSALSWVNVVQGLDVYGISVTGANILANTTQGIYISRDDGASWTRISVFPNTMGSIYTSGKKAAVWFYGEKTVSISTDEGLTWKKVPYDASESPQCMTSDDNYFYASSMSGIFRLPVKP